MRKVYKAGWCPLCRQGWIIVVKDIRASVLYLCCAECETQWENPNRLKEGICLPFNTYGKYEYPSENEIVKQKWLELLEGFYEKP